jgi:hypothetical protein
MNLEQVENTMMEQLQQIQQLKEAGYNMIIAYPEKMTTSREYIQGFVEKYTGVSLLHSARFTFRDKWTNTDKTVRMSLGDIIPPEAKVMYPSEFPCVALSTDGYNIYGKFYDRLVENYRWIKLGEKA